MTVSIAEAKAKFSELVKRVEAGEQVLVTRHGKVVAVLAPPPAHMRPSLLGMFKGKGWMSDDFDTLGSEWDAYVR